VHVSSFYPVLCVENVAASARFYQEHFGFVPTFESDWYVSLRQPGGKEYELAILDPSHATMPPEFRASVKGLLLNFEVDDVDAEHERLVRQKGLAEIVPLRDEAFGQRHFIVADPNGVLIDVITLIPPAEEYRESFAE